MSTLDVLYESQAARHALPDCWSASPLGRAASERQQFLIRLDSINVDETAMFELHGHGFLKTRACLPQEPFHIHFPLGSQVNRYESTMAYAYTQGTAFAYKANALCRTEDWEALFQNYGRCVRCLWSYSEKMQARYGKDQSLYGGMQGNWDRLQHIYEEGSLFEWKSFTSTTSNLDIALKFASGFYSATPSYHDQPVLFRIQTQSRGAPILRWSQYPNEDEVLLLPFQRFQVLDVFVRQGTLMIDLMTVKPDQALFTFKALCPLAFRYSRDLNDRDDRPRGPSVGTTISGTKEGNNWILVSVIGLGDRFLPRSINGEEKLQPQHDSFHEAFVVEPVRQPPCCLM